jgi:hypothetical protein
VTPLVNDPTNPGLQFSASGQLSIVGLNAIDLTFKYRVQAIGGAGSFTANTLSLSGIVFGNNSGVTYISGENKSLIGNELASTVVIDDHESNVSQFVSTGNFTAQAGLVVTTNLFLQGLASTDSIDLSSFSQRFSQSGPHMLAGDYNQNGVVDAADFVVWRNNSGPPDGYSVWRANFGSTAFGAGSGTVASGLAAAVPEPGVALLLLTALPGPACEILIRRQRKPVFGAGR